MIKEKLSELSRDALVQKLKENPRYSEAEGKLLGPSKGHLNPEEIVLLNLIMHIEDQAENRAHAERTSKLTEETIKLTNETVELSKDLGFWTKRLAIATFVLAFFTFCLAVFSAISVFGN